MGGSWTRPGVTPTVGRNKNGALSVFLIRDDTALYRYDQRRPNDSWSDPANPISMRELASALPLMIRCLAAIRRCPSGLGDLANAVTTNVLRSR
jgi:hypothetical protein